MYIIIPPLHMYVVVESFQYLIFNFLYKDLRFDITNNIVMKKRHKYTNFVSYCHGYFEKDMKFEYL